MSKTATIAATACVGLLGEFYAHPRMIGRGS
ncbi:hypothetical protein BH20ACT3_BH20ACT3_15640 [soil metagenome]